MCSFSEDDKIKSFPVAIGMNTFFSLILNVMMLFFLMAFCGSCKKNISQSYSKFRVQPLNYIGHSFVQPIKLSNGNFVTMAQDSDPDSSDYRIDIAEYDGKSNLVFQKKYPFTSSREIAYGIPFGTGFLVAGVTSDSKHFFIVMFDANANKIWDQLFLPTSANKEITSVACCVGMDGNIILAGGQDAVTKAFPGQTSIDTPFISKINPANGALINNPANITGVDTNLQCWVTSVYESNDSVYISGFYFYSGATALDFGSLFCLKTLENGNTQWFYSAPHPPANSSVIGNPYIMGFNIAETNTGPIVIATTNAPGFSVGEDYFNNYFYSMIGYTTIFSFDPATGSKLDSATFGNEKTEFPFIHPTNDGGFIIATTANNFLNSLTTPTIMQFTKTDAKLNIQWQKTYNPDGNNYVILGLIPLSDGYEVIGQKNSITNNKPYTGTFFLQIDLQGNIAD